MENSKWVKLAPKEEILKLKEQEDFKFCISNLCKHFDIPDKRMGELLKYYKIEVIKLTKNIKLTTLEWVEQCSEKHNNFYDYSKSVYVNSKSLIIIGCPVHGDVQVNPNRHKNGSGCKRCASKKHSIFKSIDKDLYFKEVDKVHNYKYDYSKTEDFKTTHNKITIGCPIHGDFIQVAHTHKKGAGCEKCSYIERGKDKAISFEEYLKRATQRFGNKYRYLKNSYINISGDITYTCDIHGDVTQNAKVHLLSRGCSKCFRKNEKSNTEDFIEKSKIKHNNFYTYPKTIYGKSNRDSVIITCPFHGEFEQQANTHLNGGGCKTCANIKSNIGYGGLTKEDIENSKSISCSFYLLKFNLMNISYYKIGISTNMKDRINKLKGAHKANIEVLKILDSNLFDCAKIEGELLKKYKKYNKKGEVPFGIEGSTECLSINTPIEEIITYLESI